MKSYTAITRNDTRIITVLAYDMDDAKDKIVEQLKMNPSRYHYLSRWQEDGELVIEN